MRYDTNLVTRIDNNFLSSSAFEFNGVSSDLTRETDDYFFFDGRPQYYHTNLNGIDIAQDTFLLDRFIIREDAKTNNPDQRDTLVMKFYNAFATNAEGEEVPLSAEYDTIILTNLIFDPDLPSSVEEDGRDVAKPSLTLRPNPANNFVDIFFDSPQTGEITIYTIDGQRLAVHRVDNKNYRRIPVDELSVGLYILSMRSSDGTVSTDRFVKGVY